MICTCTMNPSLDYYMEFEKKPADGQVNRSQLEYYEAGGKGINVSIVLNNLGIPSRAFGFLGGFTKDFYISLLAKYEEIRPNFTYINGHTRINVKLRTQNEKPTDMNAAGPYITHDDMDNLMKKVSSLYEQDYFVLAGNEADYLVEDTEKMLRNAIASGVRVVMDTNPGIMKDLITDRPFMFKTTPEELSMITGTDCSKVEDAIQAARTLHEQGVHHVLVVNGNRYAVLVCDEGTYECDILKEGAAVNTVGTGDSMVAGFLMDYMRSKDPVDSFRFGASCGSATAYSKGLATREKIDAMYESTSVRKVD